MIIGIGCDITSIEKFKNKDISFIEKVLTKDEIQIFNNRNGKKKEEFLAGHFSCKEAIIKALYNIERLNFQDISILYNNEVPFFEYKDYNIKISISHDDNNVFTVAIVEKPNN